MSDPATRQGGRIARNALVSASAEVAAKLSTFALTVVAARELDPADFGAFAFAIAFTMLLMPLPTSFDPELERRGAAEPPMLPALVAQNLVWRTATGIPLFLLAGVGGILTRTNQDAAVVLALVLGAAVIDSYADVGRSIATARQSLGGVSAALVVQRSASAILGISAIYSGWGVVGLAAGYLVGSIVGGVVVFAAVRRLGVGWAPEAITRQGLIAFARPMPIILAAVWLSTVMFRVDAVLVDTFLGSVPVAEYMVAYRLFETVLFISWAMKRAVFPVLSAATDDAAFAAPLKNSVAVFSVLYLPLAALLFVEAHSIISLIFGDRYADASGPLLQAMAIAPFVYAVGQILIYALVAREQRRDVLVISAVPAVLNVVLNVIFIPIHGALAAAVTTTVSLAVGVVMCLWYLRSTIAGGGLHRGILGPLLASLVFGVSLMMMDLPVIIGAMVGGVIYLIVFIGLAGPTGFPAIGGLATVTTRLRRRSS